MVALLQPSARFSKLVEGAGEWRVNCHDTGEPFYCAVLEGQCWVAVGGQDPVTLRGGDFVLVPAMHYLVGASPGAVTRGGVTVPVQIADGHYRIGRQDGPTDLLMRVGHCSFGSPDAALLVSLLPQVLVVRGEPRLMALVQMVGEESRARRPAREVVLERLLEVLLIEALRCGAGTAVTPGLVRGLADERLAVTLRAMHAAPERAWTVAALAAEAALSRSAFFARFSRTMGVAPIEYLLAWRMALAKRLLRGRELGVEEVAERVGYGSASTFSVAFSRQVGLAPTHYARSVAA